MIILKKIIFMVLEFILGKFMAAAKDKKAQQERLKESEEAAKALEEAKKRGANEQELIDRELDVLNGTSPKRR